MINELADKSRKRMNDAMSSLKRDLDSISTGRATPNLLDTIKAEVYGDFMALSQLATVSVSDSTSLMVQVWDKSNVKAVEKAIVNSNLGFNPQVDGTNLRISLPKLSEERRKELAKLSKKYGEDKKVVVRNVRRDSLDEFKKKEKELSASKDDIHSFSDIIQKLTDEFVKKIDEEVVIKEKELMTI